MKIGKKETAILSCITGVLVVTTVVLLFITTPWKNDSKDDAQDAAAPSSIATEVTTDLMTNSTGEDTTYSESTESCAEYVPTSQQSTESTVVSSEETTEASTSETTTETTTESTMESTTTATTSETTKKETETEATTESATRAPSTTSGTYDLSGMVIVLDPGHQKHANSDTEAVAPWSDERKPKVSSGTKGVATSRPEYEVVLEIGLVLRDYLESMGATVIMTRTSNDVDISNIERANIAVENDADVFLRLHCDAAESSSARGIGVFVCSRGELADSQEKWGNWLGNCLEESTGSHFRGCNASTTYSGLNWCTSVPSFLLEMGFMTNSDDDRLLSDPEYQNKICEGIAAFCYKMKSR